MALVITDDPWQWYGILERYGGQTAYTGEASKLRVELIMDLIRVVGLLWYRGPPSESGHGLVTSWLMSMPSLEPPRLHDNSCRRRAERCAA